MSELQTGLLLMKWGIYLGFGGLLGAQLAVHTTNGLTNLFVRLGITRDGREGG